MTTNLKNIVRKIFNQPSPRQENRKKQQEEAHEQPPKKEAADSEAQSKAEQPERKTASRSYFFIWASALVLVFAGATVFLALSLKHKTGDDAQALKKEESSGKKVETAAVKESTPDRTLLLIGETRPFYSVTLYARVSGFMDGLFADIGDKVKSGQKLAHVESPETEQAFNSARANAINLGRIAERNRLLLKKKLISQQEADQAFANADVAKANAQTEGVLKSYQDVVAPFDGVISNRFVDPGALLQNASGSQAASQPLFTITQADPIRVYMYVDQKDSPYVKVGDPVEISLADQTQNQLKLEAKVDKIAAELDSKTRTLLVEVIVPNHENAIVPGGFVQVKMQIHTPSYMELPIQALVMRGTKAFVPVIQGGENGQIHFTPVDLVENDGENIFIRSGIEKDQLVALNVGNTMADGQKIKTQTQMAGTAGGETATTTSASPGTVGEPHK